MKKILLGFVRGNVLFFGLIQLGISLSQAETPRFETGILYDSDVSASLKSQVESDLEYFGQMQGQKTSPLHSEVYGGMNGQGYLNWFLARVKQFGVDDCGGASAVACYKSAYPNKIWVAANYLRGNYPQMGRLMTLVHEARHAEDKWPHYKCPMNFPYRSIWTGNKLRGKSACDITPFGSYGAASILLNNISKFCENCSEKTKVDAKIYSDDQKNRVVNADAARAMKEDFAY